MKDPKKINLMTQDEVRALGWAAESRDADGHLVSTCAPFDTNSLLIEYVRECAEHGDTVTIWPNAFK